MRVPAQTIQFIDRALGYVAHDMAQDFGDFVLKRADGLFAYQLAVVVDDAAQGVTDVVRGADLLNSTTRQIYLQNKLGLATPRYLHIPVVTNAAGEKLSKQTLADAISHDNASETLCRALLFLNNFFSQPIPANLNKSALPDIWRWAIAHWKIN